MPLVDRTRNMYSPAFLGRTLFTVSTAMWQWIDEPGWNRKNKSIVLWAVIVKIMIFFSFMIFERLTWLITGRGWRKRERFSTVSSHPFCNHFLLPSTPLLTIIMEITWSGLSCSHIRLHEFLPGQFFQFIEILLRRVRLNWHRRADGLPIRRPSKSV